MINSGSPVASLGPAGGTPSSLVMETIFALNSSLGSPGPIPTVSGALEGELIFLRTLTRL